MFSPAIPVRGETLAVKIQRFQGIWPAEPKRCQRRSTTAPRLAGICQGPLFGTVSHMHDKPLVARCGICDAQICDEGTICPPCQRDFESSLGDENSSGAASLDLGKYTSRMFPWEQIQTEPRLISVHPVWLVLALGMIVLVLLLALLRTPLPSCWELSS